MVTKQEFSRFLFKLSVALPKFAPPLDEKAAEVWYEELGSLSLEQLMHVYQTCVRSLDAFPSIRQALEFAGAAEASPDDKGRQVADLIYTAIGKFGSIVGSMERAAAKKLTIEQFVGPIGSEVIRLQGGWNRICEIVDYDNAPTMKAQWRGLAASLARSGKLGDTSVPPDFARLPEATVAILKGTR